MTDNRMISLTARLATIVLLGFVISFGCSQGPEITAEGGPIGKKKSKTKSQEPSQLVEEGGSGGEHSGDDGSDDDNADDDGDDDHGEKSNDDGDEPTKSKKTAKVKYPRLEFKGNGIIDCDKRHPTLVDELTTQLSQELLTVEVNKAQISNAGKAEVQANEEIQKSVGVMIFKKVTAEERKALKDIEFADYAIFATSIDKKTRNELYTLSSPLPVFPLPADRARYLELRDDGPKTWTAQVNGGGRSFTSKVTISYIGEVGNEVTIMFHNEIPEDTESSKTFRSIYEEFPIAREAVYTINYKTKDVRRIKATNWFFGDRCKKTPSVINLVYDLCRKTSEEKDESFYCH